jgi:hypothetical protein
VQAGDKMVVIQLEEATTMTDAQITDAVRSAFETPGTGIVARPGTVSVVTADGRVILYNVPK